jgi:hypothetical protein
MHCQLFIPDFLPAAGAPAGGRLDALETLLARGRRTRRAAVSSEAWLLARFEVPKQRDWPVAPYSLLADGGATERHFWMRADPVHLRVGRDSVALMDSEAFDVSRGEAEALVEALNRHFGDALPIYPLRPERWYARLGQAPDIEAAPPRAVRGRPIEDHLPTGRDAMRFDALMNEAQMVLHEHPVNVAREARGAPAINSLWFWGGGVFVPPRVRPFEAVIANDALARGLAHASGAGARALPKSAPALLGAGEDEGTMLIVHDAMQDEAGYADEARLHELRAAIERNWFAPLLAALRSGRIGMLTLHLSGTDSLIEAEIARTDLRHFWRRRKPLAAYVA